MLGSDLLAPLDLHTAVFRSNPAYEFVSLECLTPAERQVLALLTQDAADVCGILHPLREGGVGLSIKAVSCEAAQLFQSLHLPGPLPPEVFTLLGESVEDEVAKLVLDQMLEVEVEGVFRSGTGADALFHHSPHDDAAADTVLSQLSLAAICHAYSFDEADRASVAARLYFYHRYPASPKWRQVYPSEAVIAETLGLGPGGVAGSRLSQHWTAVDPQGPTDRYHLRWSSWRRRDGDTATDQLSYKLYVSPHPSRLPDVLPEVIRVLTEAGAGAFKVGRDVYTLLRPDKLVAYFASAVDLHATAGQLVRGLDGVEAQGVPFTCQLDTNGLLSWAIDPSLSQHLPGAKSWRRWVTNRLASALVTARRAALPAAAATQFALERLRRDGVATESWLFAPTTQEVRAGPRPGRMPLRKKRERHYDSR